jgi:hypothetical protein
MRELRYTRAAHARARRIVERLRAAGSIGAQQADEAQGAVDAVAKVSRQLTCESSSPSAEFTEWWKEVFAFPRVQALKKLRNELLKGNAGSTLSVPRLDVAADLKFPNGAVVRIRGMTMDTGTSQSGVQSIDVAPPDSDSRWIIRGGYFDGKPFLDVLDDYLNWLESDVIPKAERLLT